MSYMPARRPGPGSPRRAVAAHRRPAERSARATRRPLPPRPRPPPRARREPRRRRRPLAARSSRAERPSWAEQPAPEPDVPRFMSATDFLERRAEHEGYGPPTWGWRGRLHRWTGGTVSPQMGADEMQYARDRARDPARLRRAPHDRLPQPQGRCRQDDQRAGRRLHLRHRPWRRRGRLGQQRDPRHPRHPGPARRPRQHHARAARGPRALQRRLPGADRRPGRVRPLAGRRPLRRPGLRRAAATSPA